MTGDIYIFGSSTNAQACLAVCRKHGIDVAGFLDDFSNEAEVLGVPVLRPGAADRSKPVVVSSPTLCLRIILRLDWMGFRTMNLSQFYSTLGLEPDWGGDMKIHRPEYEWLREMLADDESRSVFDAVARFRQTLEPLYTASVCRDISLQWFDPEFFRPGPHVLADGGAYDGDTAEAFIKACPEYRAAHLFEPSRELAEKARTRMAGKRGVFVHQSGLDGMHSSAFLENPGTPSGRKGVAGERVLFEKLDDLDIETPTMIKLDVEGCEVGAIMGAERTIREHRPFLAIAVYHKPEDLRVVPRLISRMQDYKFYLRHYTQFYHETVLYCI